MSLNPRKSLFAACGAHLVQDGLVALQFVFLPLLAQSLSLSYTQVGILRAAGTSVMSIMEMPAGILADRLDKGLLLSFGLICAGVGYLGVSLSTQYAAVMAFIMLAGLGAAIFARGRKSEERVEEDDQMTRTHKSNKQYPVIPFR